MSNTRMPSKKAAMAFLRSLESVTDPTWDTATKEFAIALKTAMAVQVVTLGKKSVPQSDIIEMAFALLANQERYVDASKTGPTVLSPEPPIQFDGGLEIRAVGPDQRLLSFTSEPCTNPDCVIHNFLGTPDAASVRAHAAKIIELVAELAPDFPDLPYLRSLVSDRHTTCKRMPDGILLSGRGDASNMN